LGGCSKQNCSNQVLRRERTTKLIAIVNNSCHVTDEIKNSGIMYLSFIRSDDTNVGRLYVICFDEHVDQIYD